MIPLSRKKTKTDCEIDLRKEFDDIVFGIGGCKPHNHLVLLRVPRQDSTGKLIKCVLFKFVLPLLS